KAAGSTALDADNLVRHVLNRTGVYQSQDDTPQATLRPGGPFGDLLDRTEAATSEDRKQMADEVFQGIIRFRKESKQMDEAERAKIEARIARYSNSLVERRQTRVGR